MNNVLYRKLPPRPGFSEYREATNAEIVDALLLYRPLREQLFAMARTRALVALEPWDEVEGPRWMRATASGPAVAWVFSLTHTRWAFQIDDLESGVTTSKENAMSMADAALLRRGWMLKS